MFMSEYLSLYVSNVLGELSGQLPNALMPSATLDLFFFTI